MTAAGPTKLNAGNGLGKSALLRTWAWAGFIATVLLVFWGGYLVALDRGTVAAAPPGWWAFGITLVVYSAVGLIIVRSPAVNVVGFLMIALGLGTSIDGWAEAYAVHSWVSGPLPLHTAIAHVAAYLEVYLLAVVALILLVFPSGRLPSRRWWIAVGAVVVGFFALSTTSLLTEVTSTRLPENEVLAPALFGRPDLSSPIFGFIFFLFWFPLLLGVGHLVVRFFRARGIERLQLKWLTYVLVVGLALLALAEPLPSSIAAVVRAVGGIVMLLGAPVAVGVAVLRYRLYEVDRIISRTVGYAVVVGVLGGVYAVGAVWLPAQVTSSSPVFVAGATLAVAALFNPLRRKVLHWVDRRFYRSRYDAERVADEFSGRLRNQTDVMLLSTDWLSVVATTMQPSSIGLWVREK